MIYSPEYTERYSKFLIRLAWSVEVLAVLIGLTVSVVVAVSAYQASAKLGSTGFMSGSSSVLVATLPFVLVAAVELCKIPLTFTFMRVQSAGWRMLFLFFVMFLCLITFETMFNGFERNFSNLNRVIDVRKNEILDSNSQIALLERRRAHIVKFTEDEVAQEAESMREAINDDYKKQLTSVEVNARKMLVNVDYSFKDGLETQINDLMTTRDKYYADWAKETSAVENRFSKLVLGNIQGSTDERTRLLSELEALKAEFKTKMSEASFLTRSQVETKYRALIKDKEDQLSKITTGFLGSDAIEKQSSMESQMKQQIAFVNSKYQGRIDDVNARIEGLKKEIAQRTAHNAQLESSIISKSAKDKLRYAVIREERRKEADQTLVQKQKQLEVIAELSFGIDEKIFDLKNKQRNLNSEINQLINQNQIYRLAMYAFDKQSGAEVTRGEVATVAIVWFGSLSLIASVCGVMLALAGFYLKRMGTRATSGA